MSTTGVWLGCGVRVTRQPSSPLVASSLVTMPSFVLSGAGSGARSSSAVAVVAVAVMGGAFHPAMFLSYGGGVWCTAGPAEIGGPVQRTMRGAMVAGGGVVVIFYVLDFSLRGHVLAGGGRAVGRGGPTGPLRSPPRGGPRRQPISARCSIVGEPGRCGYYMGGARGSGVGTLIAVTLCVGSLWLVSFVAGLVVWGALVRITVGIGTTGVQREASIGCPSLEVLRFGPLVWVAVTGAAGRGRESLLVLLFSLLGNLGGTVFFHLGEV